MADESAEKSKSQLDETSSDVEETAKKSAEGGSEKSPQSVKADLRALEAVLKRTGRALGRPVIIEGALWYGVTLVAVVLSSLVAMALIAEHGYQVARWILTVGIGSATLGAVVALATYLWRRPGPMDVAARVQRHSGEFRSDLVAALEFGRRLRDEGEDSLRDDGVSPSMARAHLARTLERVYDAAQNHSLAHLVPARNLAPPVLAMSGGVALLLVPLLLNPGWTLGVLSGERVGTPVVGERVVEKTIVGSLEGVFEYPAYTGRQREIRPLGTGYLEALQGTQVNLYATLMPGEWASVQMMVETGDDEEPRVVEMNLGDRYRASASITIEESGHYWFRARTIEGRPVEDRQKRRIVAVEDDAPQIEIVSHSGRIGVQPDDIIEFEIEAHDEYGLESIRRAVHFQGAEDDAEYERIGRSELSSEPRSAQLTSTLDLGPLDLRPKDAVVVYFEARDVNRVTGPGEARSDSVILYVESKEDKHLENIAAQQQVMEALLMHLGDVLESPVGTRQLEGGSYEQRVDEELGAGERIDRYRRAQSIHENRRPILEQMEELAKKLEEDPLMVSRNLTIFEGLTERLWALHDEGDELFERLQPQADRRDLSLGRLQETADFVADSEETLEQGVMALEDLLMTQKMELVEKTAEDIEELREQLRDLLEQYRDTEDPELKEAIEREIHRLRQRMEELTARMQMMLREMPQEHINLEALEGMEMAEQSDDLMAQLDALEDLLAEGDIDAALAALDEMGAHLDAMNHEMGDSFAEMQPSSVSELDQAVSEMMDQIRQLQEMEQEIIEETRQLSDDLRQERSEQLERMIEPLTQELLEAIDAQKEQLDRMEERDLSAQDQAEVERAQNTMEQLRDMVEERDMEQSLERAVEAERRFRSMRSTMSISGRYAQEGTQRSRDLERSLRDVGQMSQRGEEIRERIEDFMEAAQHDLSSSEEDRFDELADRQQMVRERTEDLRQSLEEQAEAHPELDRAMQPSQDEEGEPSQGSPVEEAERAMGEAEEWLRERQVQRALDEERRALEQLEALDQGMGQALQQRRQQERESAEQRGHSDREQVEIPGEDSGELRERIREEMMQGMRDGRDAEFEAEIERYFRSLVE